MLYTLGLLATIAVCSWLALDPLLALGARARSRSLALAALAACGGTWAAAELLLQFVEAPESRLALRRVLYLAGCFLPVTWVWLGVQAERGFGRSGGAWIAALAVLPSAFFWSTLFWAPGLLVEWVDDRVVRGPLFQAYLGWSYLLCAAGLAAFTRAAARMHRAGGMGLLALVPAVLVPVLGNFLYVLGAIGPEDPTPILLGGAALLVRVGVVDSGLAAHLPFARGDLLDQIDAGVVIADRTGEVVVANPAAHRLLREPVLVGAHLAHVLAGAAEHPERTLDVRRFPLRTGMGEVGYGAILTDRTDAERAARRLQLAARLEALGFLTAGIAHEVNNPLAYIHSNLAQLEELAKAMATSDGVAALDPRLRELGREAADVVGETREGVERIAALVKRLRGFARHDPAGDEQAAVSLARVAERAASMARMGFAPGSIRIEVESVAPVRSSENHLVQIVLNLLVNAIQSGEEDPDVEIRVGPCDGGASLAVLDRGPGISPEALKHIFDPFFSTRPDGVGTGLGLTLAYELARQHGGELSAENRPDGGACFTLWLPVEAEAGSADGCEDDATPPAAAPEG
jgi:signal transduction histidine kinase